MEAPPRHLERGELSAQEIGARVAGEPNRTTASLRKLRRELSRALRPLGGTAVLRIAAELLAPEARCPRWIAYELVHHHKRAMAALNARWLRRLGKGLSAWDEVDPFGLYLLGPAWRERRVSDGELYRWALAQDRWQRRSALVATVALNSTARGGRGDPGRTLAICDLLLDDRDDMVVKAMSWALRALAVRDPARVTRYLARHEDRLAARVLRETRSKLTFGLKTPRRSS